MAQNSRFTSVRINNAIPIDEFVAQSGIRKNTLLNLALMEYIERHQDLIKAPC